MKRNIPSVARVEPRAAVRRRRPVVLVRGGLGVRAHAGPLRPVRPGRRRHDVLDGDARVLAQPLDDVAPQPARALAGERRDDHLVDALVLDDLHRGGVRVGVRDLAVRLDALVAERGERGPEPPLGLGVLGLTSGRSAGRRSGSSAGPSPRAAGCGRAAARRARSRSRPRGRSPGRCAQRRRRRRARRPVAGEPPELVEDVLLAQPARLLLGVRRDDQLVDVLGARTSSHGGDGRPRRRRRGRESRPRGAPRPSGRPPARGRAARVPVDDVAGARLVHRRDDDRADRALARRAAGRRRAARRRRASRSRRRGRASLGSLAHACASCERAALQDGVARARERRTRTGRRRPAGSRRS